MANGNVLEMVLNFAQKGLDQVVGQVSRAGKNIGGLFDRAKGSVAAFNAAANNGAVIMGRLEATVSALAGSLIGIQGARGTFAVMAGADEAARALERAHAAAARLGDVGAFSDWEAAVRGKQLQAELAAKYEAISRATGVSVRSHQELVRAIDEGKIHYDAATASWKAGAAERAKAEERNMETVKKATGDALKEMRKRYREYAGEVRRLQDDIAGRERSLAAELRDLARSGMSDADAWRDRKREAEEYAAAAKKAAEEAKAAQASGDTITAAAKWKEAVQYADDAKSAYRSLNTEVKNGDQVVVSAAQALETAMRGVREAGQLGIDILKEQQQAAYKAMDALEKDSGFAGLVQGLDEAERKWLEGWQNMKAEAQEAVEEVSFRITEQTRVIEGVESAWLRSWQNNRNYFVKVSDELKSRLDAACQPRTVKVYVAEVVKKATGGLVGEALRFAVGGKLPGYGGGDRIPALLESGEYVIRKEAVKKFGAGLFDALNHLRLPDLSGFLPPMPAPAAPAFAASGRVVNVNLTLGGETFPLKTDERTAAKIERWYALRSSNRVTRNQYRP